MTIINQMLENYNLEEIKDKKNAMKEIMQEITLAALAKTDFFKHAAFYGGTALRIFHNLNRFSEDLDFTLLTTDLDFTFQKYIPAINEVVLSLGLKFSIAEKEKTKDSQIKSAFLKGNTKEHFLIFFPESSDESSLHKNEKITIKFEIDIIPPEFATTELKFGLLPFPYQVRLYDKPSLFAGKIHAVIARNWNRRIKGRDLYDYIFYLATNTPVNIKHLEARLKQTKTIKQDVELTIDLLKEILNDRFNEIDYKNAKEDVIPFIKDEEVLEIWSKEFFIGITEKITAI